LIGFIFIIKSSIIFIFKIFKRQEKLTNTSFILTILLFILRIVLQITVSPERICCSAADGIRPCLTVSRESLVSNQPDESLIETAQQLQILADEFEANNLTPVEPFPSAYIVLTILAVVAIFLFK